MVEAWPSGLRGSDEVRAALDEGRAVVALESTIITHGLPRPRNLAVALEVEKTVRSLGAVPATVGVIDGIPTLGLTRLELERIAADTSVDKLSTRDLPLAVARRLTGGTTVASTAWLAARAGIQVFATGAIGGVHRGTPLDVSSDLAELHRTALIVTCAGVKSILDVAATRELLDTLGVLVMGWRTDAFPMFYTAGRALAVDARAQTAVDVTEVWRAHRALGMHSALLLGVPVPDYAALQEADLEGAILEALSRAATEGIQGKAVTPFLLRDLVQRTGGASLEANVALLLNNAGVAAEVALELARR